MNGIMRPEVDQVINPAYYKAVAGSFAANGNFPDAYTNMREYLTQRLGGVLPCDESLIIDESRVGHDLMLLTDLAVLSGNEKDCLIYWSSFSETFPGSIDGLFSCTNPGDLNKFIQEQLERYDQVRCSSPVTSYITSGSRLNVSNIRGLYTNGEANDAFARDLLQASVILSATSVFVPQNQKPRVYSAYLESRVYNGAVRLSAGILPTTGELMALHELSKDVYVSPKTSSVVADFVIACQSLYINQSRPFSGRPSQT